MDNALDIAQLVNVSVDFRFGTLLGGRRSLRALDNVSLSIGTNEAVGLVGESGSGKSTLGRVLLGLQTVSAGAVTVIDRTWGHNAPVNPDRSGRVQAVFQDPRSSLNPRLRIGKSVAEGLPRRSEGQDEIRMAVVEALHSVGLSAHHASMFPAELSGGQLQRAAIARAIVGDAKFIVFDEAVSSLDASTQCQIVLLMDELRLKRDLTFLFVSHDMAVIRHATDKVFVMHQGEIVESGLTPDVLSNPRSPYTASLVDSILPVITPHKG